jgi:hypothetical protein
MRLLAPDWGSLDPAALSIAGLAFLGLFGFRLGMVTVLGLGAGAGLLHRLVLGG